MRRAGLYQQLGTVGRVLPICACGGLGGWGLGGAAKVLRVGRKADEFTACVNRLPNSFSAWSDLAHVHFCTLAYTLAVDLNLFCFLNPSGGSRPPWGSRNHRVPSRGSLTVGPAEPMSTGTCWVRKTSPLTARQSGNTMCMGCGGYTVYCVQLLVSHRTMFSKDPSQVIYIVTDLLLFYV